MCLSVSAIVLTVAEQSVGQLFKAWIIGALLVSVEVMSAALVCTGALEMYRY